MTNDTLQQLLAKYQQGTISNEELEQLNVLSHKDDVVESAFSRARRIVVRRTWRNVAFAVAGLAVAGAGIWVIAPPHDAPMVAEVKENNQPVAESVVEVQSVEPVSQQEPAMLVARADSKTSASNAKPAVPSVKAREAMPVYDEPIVICNNQCDADSVINDIWKFLTA